MIRRRTAPPSPVTLSRGVVAVLLEGWAAASMTGPGPDDGQLFDLFRLRGAGVVALWQQHEPYLRAEAARLRVSPTWGPRSQYFFAEFLARDARDDRVNQGG